MAPAPPKDKWLFNWWQDDESVLHTSLEYPYDDNATFEAMEMGKGDLQSSQASQID